MKLAPISLFVYNRPKHLKQTVNALKKNRLAKESELFIFSDGPKNIEDQKKVDEVRQYLNIITGFKKITIFKSKNNLGLANSIISGVTKVVNKYGKIIVLEDDLLTSPYFLQFMNEGLNFYEKENKVANIHGYVYPINFKLPETFFLRDPGCLGWGTWKNNWKLFNKNGMILLKEIKNNKLTYTFDYDNSYTFTDLLEKQVKGKVDSWAIRWYASLFINNKLTLYPGKSLVFHNGSDNSGTHGGVPDDYAVKLSNNSIKIQNVPIEENIFVRNKYIKYFRSIRPYLILRIGKKIINRVRDLLKYKT